MEGKLNGAWVWLPRWIRHCWRTWRQRISAIGTLSSPFFFLPFLSPSLSLLSHSLTLGIVYILLIDRARGTRASAVWHDDPREHHVGILPQIIDATSMASIHKFISSLPNGLNTRVGGQGELAVLWTETKNCHRMYLFFSCIFFCDFRFSISIFDF